MAQIELSRITFRYDAGEPPVLKDFSMRVEKGACLAVTGGNGAGKTTLFRILNGLSFPETGKYLFEGTEITEAYLRKNVNSKKLHKQIGYLFQNPDIMLFNARVYDEIAFGPRQMGYTDAETDGIVKDCMRLFELEALRDKAPYHLSGGQKKRVALAAVMALNPGVLVLDEPYAGLDRRSQEQLTDFLRELKAAGKTLIAATHKEELLTGIADDRIILQQDTLSL